MKPRSARRRKSLRSLQSKRLHVEALEKRVLLAGDVYASIVDGDLVITGTDTDTDLSVYIGGNAQDGYVPTLRTDGTLYMNGQLYDWFSDPYESFSGFTSGNVRIVMGSGNDALTVSGCPQSISIDTGAGNDRVECQAVAADTTVVLGAGDDVFSQGGILNPLTLDAGAGDDNVSFHGDASGEPAILQGGEGNDVLRWQKNNGEGQTEFDGVTVEGFETLPRGLQTPTEPVAHVSIDIIDGELLITSTGPDPNLMIDVGGNDQDGYSALVHTGGMFFVNGQRYIGISPDSWFGEFESGSIRIVTGDGTQDINVMGSARSLSIDTGAGNDHVVFDVNVIDATVTLGEGDDKFEQRFPEAAITGQLALDAGAGNDVVWFEGITIGGAATLLGGEGDDRIVWLARNSMQDETQFGDVTVEGFEHLPAGLQPPVVPDPAPVSNVTVEIINGNLVITGDEGVNSISITRTDDGAYVITGLERDVDGVSTCTLVNGQPAPATFDDVPGSILISLGDGDDSLIVSGLIAHDLTIDVGSGNDLVKFDAARVAGDLAIGAGSGDDRVETGMLRYSCPALHSRASDHPGDALAVQGNMVIQMGQGDDGIELSLVDVQGLASIDAGDGNDWGSGELCAFEGDMIVEMGRGSDWVDLSFVDAHGLARIDAGVGADNDSVRVVSSSFENDLRVVTGGGADEITVSGGPRFGANPRDVIPAPMFVRGNLIIDTGEGDDLVTMSLDYPSANQPSVEGDVVVETGEGNDGVSLYAVNVKGSVSIDTGTGNDWLGTNAFLVYNPETGEWMSAPLGGEPSIDSMGVVQGDMNVHMGEGDDSAYVVGIAVAGAATLDGGPGADWLSESCFSYNTAGVLAVSGFENIPDNTVSNVVRRAIISIAIVDGDLVISSSNNANLDLDILVETVDGNPENGYSARIQTDGILYVSDVMVESSSWEGTFTSGDVRISTGNGDDTIRVNGSAMSVSISTNEGNDDVFIAGTPADVNVSLGRGDDTIRVNGSAMSVSISTNEGNDDVSIAGTPADARVSLGEGDDTFVLSAPSTTPLGFLSVDGYKGDDRVSVQGVTICNGARLKGGDGHDTFEWRNWLGEEEAKPTNVVTTGFEDSPPEPVLDDLVSLVSHITVEVVDGDLIITGDETNNYIFILQSLPGQYQVAVMDEPGSPDEWFNGTIGMDTPPQYYDVTGTVLISLSGGDDYVGLYNCYANDMTIDTGEGNDLIQCDRARFAGDLTIIGGSGDDRLERGAFGLALVGNPLEPGDFFSVAGNLTLEMGQGDDRVDMSHVKVQGTSRIDTGEGNDIVDGAGSVFAGDLGVLDGGLGVDSLNEDYLDLNMAGAWVVSGFENVDDVLSQHDDAETALFMPVGFIGPAPRAASLGARQAIVDPRESLGLLDQAAPAGESAPPAPVAGPLTAAESHAAALDLVFAAWESATSRQQDEDQDDAEQEQLLLLVDLD